MRCKKKYQVKPDKAIRKASSSFRGIEYPDLRGKYINHNKENPLKTMNCKQLGGACDKEFHANTFDDIAELSKAHGMAMFKKQDKDHLEAMNKMQGLMKELGAMEEWFESKREEFEALPED